MMAEMALAVWSQHIATHEPLLMSLAWFALGGSAAIALTWILTGEVTKGRK